MRSLSRSIRTALPVALAGAALASCALAGFSVLDEPASSAGAGGAGTTSTGTTSTGTSTSTTSTTPTGTGGQGGAPCGLATFPGPPSIATPAGSEEFVVAVRSIDFGDNDKTKPGLDLDGKCTCTPNKTPAGCCQVDGPSCQMATKACDGPRGVDNAGASVFQMLATFLGNFGSDFYSQRAEQGFWSTLFRVRGYNGQADDDRVELDVFASKGFEHAEVPPDAALPVPKWDGKDPWYVTEDSVEDPADGGPRSLDAPRWFDKKAYVSDHVLVASLPTSVLRLAGLTSNIDVHISAGFIVARIESLGPGKGFALKDGLIVFRWLLKDVFLALSSYRDDAGKPICTDSPFYKTGRSQLCALPDITVEAVAPTEPCTALSVGIAFGADPAQLGSFSPAGEGTPGCPHDTDPQFDECPPE